MKILLALWALTLLAWAVTMAVARARGKRLAAAAERLHKADGDIKRLACDAAVLKKEIEARERVNVEQCKKIADLHDGGVDYALAVLQNAKGVGNPKD